MSSKESKAFRRHVSRHRGHPDTSGLTTTNSKEKSLFVPTRFPFLLTGNRDGNKEALSFTSLNIMGIYSSHNYSKFQFSEVRHHLHFIKRQDSFHQRYHKTLEKAFLPKSNMASPMVELWHLATP